MGRSPPPGPHDPRARLPPRQPEGRPVRVDRAIPGGRQVAEEIIGEWLDANPLAVTTNQVARGINWTPDSRSISRITTVLKQRGDTRSSTRGHTGGSRTWVWTPPGGPAKLEV